LTGYTIYYGLNPLSLNQQLDVPGGATTTAQITGLDTGLYYFSIVSKTATEESARSNLATKLVL
jgi:hypothetical protein